MFFNTVGIKYDTVVEPFWVMYKITKTQTLGSQAAAFTLCHALSCFLDVTADAWWSCLRRTMASFLSSRLRRCEALWGKSARTKMAARATPMVMRPSTRNNHLQPRIPCLPSRPEMTAPAMSPEAAPAKHKAVKKVQNRLPVGGICQSFCHGKCQVRCSSIPISVFLYQQVIK